MNYFVYILSSRSRNLYTGVTNDVARRVWQHDDVRGAISREKEIKGWRRAKKIALIESINPAWEDLAETWFGWAKEKARAGPSSLSSLRSVGAGRSSG